VSLPDPAIPCYDGPPWVPFGDPRDAHHAAFRAFLHTPTQCRLVQLWFSGDSTVCRDGWFEWRAYARNGWSREVAAGAEPPDLFELADATIRGLLQEIDQQQLGG
jgi:hypothetical protein